MAQTIYCDLEGCQTEDGSPTPAVWLVTNIGSGDANAWCTPHYLELSRALLAAATPEPEPAPAPGPDQPDSDDEDQADAEAIARLEATGRARTADPTVAVAGAANGGSVSPGPAGEAVGPILDDQGAPAAPGQPDAPELLPGERPSEAAMRLADQQLQDDAAEGPKVVRRGTSKGRKAHEARKRARAAAAAEPEPAD